MRINLEKCGAKYLPWIAWIDGNRFRSSGSTKEEAVGKLILFLAYDNCDGTITLERKVC